MNTDFQAGKAFWRSLPVTVFTVLAAMLFSNYCFAEEPGNAKITVLDATDNSPLIGATVQLTAFGRDGKSIYGLTNVAGVFTYNFTEPVVVKITYIGYEQFTDTIRTREDKEYKLQANSQSLQDVVVTASHYSQKLLNSTTSVDVMSAETIRNKGANNLGEVLQNELHIDIGRDQVFGSNPSINGISGEGIKIMVDGLPIVGRLDGKLDLSQVNINNIDRVEVVTGPLSVMYGTDAMGGVINIITKTQQTEKVNLDLKGYYETVGQYNVQLNGGFAFKKNRIFISGGRNFFDGFTTLDSIQRFQEWKPREQYFVDGKYVYASKQAKFALAGTFFRELMLNRSAPTRALDYSNGDTSWTYVGNDYHYDTYRPRASATFSYNFKEDYKLNILAGYSGFIRFTNKYAKNLVTQKEILAPDASEQDSARYHLLLVRATYTMMAWRNRLSFLFGLEAGNEFTRQNRIENERQHMGDYAAFGSVGINLVKGLEIQPAVRIIYNTRYRAPLVPSISFKYDLMGKAIFRASYGMGYRAPSLKELYLDFFDSNHNLQGNPDLVPEQGHCVNASINYVQRLRGSHSLNLSTNGFFNYINNKIDWKLLPATNLGQASYQYFNLKKYITYGADLNVTYNWKDLKLTTGGLLTFYELSNTHAGTDKIKMMSPDFIFSGTYMIPVAKLKLYAVYKYNGTKPLYSVSSSIQAGTREAYHMVDVSISRDFWKDRIQLTVGGKNLAGVKNVITEGVQAIGHSVISNQVNIGWGRTFFTSLVLHFSR